MVTEKSLEDILTVLLKSTPYTFEQVKDFILIKQRTETEQPEARIVKGTVYDEGGLPLPGVTILLKGTSLGVTTGQDGTYRFTIPNLDNCVLEFSFIGMKKKEVEWKGEKELNITLEEDIAEMEEVVVTGIFERKKESFTGSASTFKGEQLKMVSNQNILWDYVPSILLLPLSRIINMDPIRIVCRISKSGERAVLWGLRRLSVKILINLYLYWTDSRLPCKPLWI